MRNARDNIYPMLNVDWYIQHPLDFEYKNYILLDYIQKVDRSYQMKVLSPYLLWTESLLEELKQFERARLEFLKSTERKSISFDGGKISLIQKRVETTESLKVVYEIVEYAMPIFETKVNMGYKLLNKYPQILFK